MSETPISKSQIRALKVRGLGVATTYEQAAAILENALLPRDGVPDGHTWRSAAKLSDQELSALLQLSAPSEDFDTTIDGREGWQ
jgi:hypothetical protein